MKAKVKAFVDAYNSTIDLVKGKLEETPVKTADDAGGLRQGRPARRPRPAGPAQQAARRDERDLRGRPRVAEPRPAYDQLSRHRRRPCPPRRPAAARRADRLAGKLVIDDAKLTAALTSDPNAVKRLLGGIGEHRRRDAAHRRHPRPGRHGSATATSPSAAETIDREVARIKDAQTAMDRRLKLKEERLRAQFTAMETALNSSQSSIELADRPDQRPGQLVLGQPKRPARLNPPSRTPMT